MMLLYHGSLHTAGQAQWRAPCGDARAGVHTYVCVCARARVWWSGAVTRESTLGRLARSRHRVAHTRTRTHTHTYMCAHSHASRHTVSAHCATDRPRVSHGPGSQGVCTSAHCAARHRLRRLAAHLGVRDDFANDPSAGSPTETLLRLLLPLNDQV